MKKYIIIGSGPAGATAAETLAKLDHDGKITVITDESYSYYKREHIIRLISKEQTEDELYPKGRDFYETIGSKLVYNHVSKIITQKNKVQLADGSSIEYDALLIASGGKPIVPPWSGLNLQGISTLYTLDDAKRIVALSKDAENVVIIGAGSISLKAIPLLSKIGLNISLVEKLNRIWPCMLDTKASVILENKLRQNGINMSLNEEVIGFKGENGKVREVLLKNNRKIQSDLVLLTLGIQVNLDFIKDSSIRFDRGILADHFLRTNFQNVFVAGDAAQVPDPLYGTQVLHPTWSYAKEQGEIAAYNMANIKKRYEGAVPLHTTNFYDLGIVAGGITQPRVEFENKHLDNEFEELYKSSVEDESFKKLVIRNNKFVGTILIGNGLKRKTLKPLIKKALLQMVDISDVKGKLLEDKFDFNSIINN